MNKRWILVLLAAFGLAAFTTLSRAEDKEKKEEGDEVKVKFDDCPAAVKATFNKETNNAKIETVDKETDDGKTIYEADVTIDGKTHEIKVAEDGKLISNKIEDADEEKKEDKKDEKK